MTLRIIANALSDCENTNWLPITNANKKNKDTDWSKLKNFDQVYKKKIDEIGGIYFIYIISQWLMGICAFIAGLFFLIGGSISCFSVNKDDAIYFWIIGIIFLILLGLFLLIYLISCCLVNNKHQLKEIDAYYDSLKIKLDPNQYSLLPIGIVTYLTMKTNENNHHLIKLSKKQLTIMYIQVYKMIQIIVASWY